MEKEKPQIEWTLFFQGLLILLVTQIPLGLWFAALPSRKQDLDDWPFLLVAVGTVVSYLLAGASVGARTNKTYWYTCFALGVIATLIGGTGRMTEIGFIPFIFWMLAAMAVVTAGGWIGQKFFGAK